jgi:16S rRNA (guanine527-N7)-methyltransferase
MRTPSFSKEQLKIIIPEITHHQFTLLEVFAESLREWNLRFNLISRKETDHIWNNHILPSLIPLAFIEFPKGAWLLDIGSGGGFPAIPIKIVRPDLQMLLVDSVRKKTLFLQKVIQDFQLKKIAVKRERIESLNHPTFVEKFDILTARAVSDVSRLIGWGRPFLKSDGSFLLWKGKTDIEELERVAQNLNLNYEVHSVPEKFKSLSEKFEGLCFFKMWF